VNVGFYDRKVYVLPRNNPCVGDGLGTVGGNPSRAWILKCDRIGVYGHELGHNLGMHHASTPSSEYGDYSDVMGLRLHQQNAPHKEQMGWLPPGQVPTVNQDGFYDIDSLETNPWEAMAPQALKIAKPDTNEYYYLSYRQPLGFDANLSSYYLSGVNVHRYRGSGAVQTYFLDSLLVDGESFVDTVNGVTVTQISHTVDNLTVQVEFDSGGPACIPAATFVDVSPGSRSAEPGTAVDFIVSITNKDSTSCGESTFYLSPSLPKDWSGMVSPNALMLHPGDTGQATLSVISSNDSGPGSYGLSVMVSDDAESMHEGSGNATYLVTVTQSDTESPTPPTGLSTSAKRKHVNLSWDAATDNVAVTGYRIVCNGATVGESTGTSFTDRAVSQSGSYTYHVVAYDAAGNMSPPSNSVTVAFAEKTNKGKSK
jgi:hypothetical protein